MLLLGCFPYNLSFSLNVKRETPNKRAALAWFPLDLYIAMV